MTLPSSGSLTVTQLGAELGLPFDIPGTTSRLLTGKPAGSLIMPTDFYGQTGGGISSPGGLTGVGTNVLNVIDCGSLSIGNPAWNRLVVVTVEWSSTASATPAALLGGGVCTIGGVPASVVVQQSANGTSASTNYGCAIISAIVPTGTTAAIHLEFTNSQARRAYAQAFRVTGQQSASPTDTMVAFDETSGGGVVNASGFINVSGGALFTAAICSCASPPSAFTWTGVTNRLEDVGPLDDRYSAGMSWPLAIQSSRPVGVRSTLAVTGRMRLAAAVWQIK